MIVICFNIKHIDYEKFLFFKNISSKERISKANRLFSISDAYRCIFAEVIVKYCVYEMYNEKIDIKFNYNEYGKPSIQNLKDFFLIYLIRAIG